MAREQRAAEDLLQDIFVHAWYQMDRFKAGNFRAWIATLSRNLILNHARATGRLALRIAVDDTLVASAANASGVSHETRLTIRDAIDGCRHPREPPSRCTT